MQPIPRSLGLVVLLAMAGFAGVGFFAIRRDVQNLQAMSQDNVLWSATQIELGLQRFHLSLADLAADKSFTALEAAREQFDQVWSQVLIMSSGRVGASMRSHGDGQGSLAAMADHLRAIEPRLATLDPWDTEAVTGIAQGLTGLEEDMSRYTWRVVAADAAAAAALRNRIRLNGQTTSLLSFVAVMISVVALYLILRENRRQRALVTMNQKAAQEAEQASRAKSRFLSMMSHELRNPLNGILGPLALLEQGSLGERQRRLIEQVRHCGQAMLQMLSGLLDYAEIQDGRLRLRREPFEVATLAAQVREALAGEGAGAVVVALGAGTSERVEGDIDRLRQIFVHLVEFILELRTPEDVQVEFNHAGETLTGIIRFTGDDAAMDWKLELLMGLSEASPDQVSTDALRPLIARGLISASRGMLSLHDGRGGSRGIVIRIPARARAAQRIRVHLETRSAALATIYQATLRSDRIEFADAATDKRPVDVVLVDSTSVDEEPLMTGLRRRFPDALFVSLGAPQHPDFFDDVVASPRDMTGLRNSIFSRLAS